jgi:hypothetical protein
MADKMQPWMKDAVRAVNTDLMQDIVNDNRSPPRPAAPPSNVTVVGSGRVQDFDVGPAYRPYVPPKEDDTSATDRGGWRDSPQIKDWKPPGLREMDAMMDAQDAHDRVARARELAEAAALKRAEAEFLKSKAQNEDNKPKSRK